MRDSRAIRKFFGSDRAFPRSFQREVTTAADGSSVQQSCVWHFLRVAVLSAADALCPQGFFFSSLMVSDLVSNTSAAINVEWAQRFVVAGGPLCIAQGTMNQLSIVGQSESRSVDQKAHADMTNPSSQRTLQSCHRRPDVPDPRLTSSHARVGQVRCGRSDMARGRRACHRWTDNRNGG